MGWPQGILIDATTGTSTALNIEDSTLRLRNVTLAAMAIRQLPYLLHFQELPEQLLILMQH